MGTQKKIWQLKEQDTEIQYPLDSLAWKGENGNFLDVFFEGDFREDSVDKRLQGLWRYRKALPLQDKTQPVSFNEGYTPIVEEEWAGKKVRLKLEYLFPTGSYKDRGATVLISKLKELGITRIVEDSSGNAGSAIAAYATKAGIACEIVVSDSVSLSKHKQLESYGADIILVNGSREDVAEKALERSRDVYYASHVWNPYFFQGTKTFAYEIWEQCKRNFPKHILLPVGNGTLLIGAYFGFTELFRRNLIPWIPTIYAAQTTHVPALTSMEYHTFKPTLAEGIAVAKPGRRQQILNMIEQTGGKCVNVSEEEILQAWAQLGKMGYYVEKTSAVALAAFSKLGSPAGCLIPLTGSGLKISH